MRRAILKISVKLMFAFSILLMLFYYKNEAFKILHNQPLWKRIMDDDHLLEKMQGPVDPLDPHLITYVRNKMIHPPSKKQYRLNYDEAGENSMMYNAYKNIVVSYMIQNPIIQHLFMNKTSGFFIEAGAMDGEFLSNTLSLEKDYGWTGLLVEPNRKLYKDLLKKNRKSWSINACLSTKPYPFLTYLLKIDVGANIALFYSASNALLQSKDVAERRDSHYSTYDKVQCIPLMTILKALNITKVDFFSLDVEDVEQQVLDTVSFSEIEIDSFVVEHRSPEHIWGSYDRAIDRNFIKWFNENGYSLYTFTRDSPHNYFFIKNGSHLHREAFSKRPAEWDPDLYKNYFS